TSMGRSGLTKKMNKLGFSFDRALRKYVYEGKTYSLDIVMNFDLNLPVSALDSRGYEENSRNIVKKTREKVQENEKKLKYIPEDVPIIREREDNKLTEEELLFVKELFIQYKKEGGMYRKILLDTYSDLPNRKPNIKTPYMISKATADEFDAFSNALTDEFRLSRNDLAEMALRYFVQEFQPLLKQDDSK
ncbi:hypothetical protein P8917_15900, partial [Bacillus atrophaeus]